MDELKIEELKPYFQAVEKILEGYPVPMLESIRARCNEDYRSTYGVDIFTKGYSLNMVMVTFFAGAENQILMGADPADVYSFLVSRGSKLQEVRRKYKSAVEEIIEGDRVCKASPSSNVHIF